MPVPRKNTIAIGPLGPWTPKRSDLITIMPDQARVILDNYNSHNRHKKHNIIELVRKALLMDEWEVNGETIIFGYDPVNDVGILLDGQNRLHGCVEANVPLTTYVVFGRDPEAFMTIDRGANRTSADDLSIAGHRNCVLLSAISKVCMAYCEGIRSAAGVCQSQVRSPEILRWIDENPKVVDAAEFAGARTNVSGIPIPGKITGAAWYLFGIKSEPLRNEFFRKLNEGADMEEGHPVLALRKRLFNERIQIAGTLKSSTAIINFMALYLLISAWNHLRAGERQIRFYKIAEKTKDNGNKVLVLPEIN